MGFSMENRWQINALKAGWRIEPITRLNEVGFGMSAGEPCSTDIAAFAIDELVCIQMRAGFCRSWREERESPVGKQGWCNAVLLKKGAAVVEGQGVRATLMPGEWLLLLDGQFDVLWSLADCEYVLFHAPRSSSGRTRGTISWQALRGERRRADALNFVWGLLDTAIANRDALSPAVTDSLSAAARDAIESSLASKVVPLTSAQPLPDILRRRVKRFIKDNLPDRDLGPERIAAELRCSIRYLHHVFEAEKTTLSRFIWNMRLDRCREDLEKESCAHLPLSMIAFGWGFADTSHFCRLFKQRFGVSPGNYRRRAASA